MGFQIYTSKKPVCLSATETHAIYNTTIVIFFWKTLLNVQVTQEEFVLHFWK